MKYFQKILLGPPRGQYAANRIMWADFLRIVSAFAVVLLHVAAGWAAYYYYGEKLPLSVDLVSAYFFRVFPAFAVPCFFMLSGMFFLDEKRDMPIRKILVSVLRLLLIFAVWSIFYATGLPATFHVPHIVVIIHGHFHLWFLPALASCYLCIPACKAILRDKKASIFTIYCALAVVCIPATLREASSRLNTSLPLASSIGFVSSPLFYFLLGGLLARVNLSRQRARWLLLLGVIAFMGTLALSIYARVCQGAFERFVKIGNFLVALYSISLFYCFSRFQMKSAEKRGMLAYRLSDLTLGVYLIHPFFLKIIPSGVSRFSPLFAIPARTVLCFALSCVAAFVIKKIPILRKIV